MRISVITVCLNSKKTIERTIQSVVNQKIKDLEYIIIDGGSNDGTQEIIKKYEDYISYWISEPDNGLFFAMNKGIEKATGDIIAILNSDDYYESDTLAKVHNYFQKNIDIVCGDEYVISNEIKTVLRFKYGEEKEIHKRIIYCHPAFFVKKSAYEKVGLFNTKYKYSSDYEWMIRAYDNNLKILKVNDIFTNCEDGGFGNSHLYEATIEQRNAALEHSLSVEMDEDIEKYYSIQLEYVKYIENYNKLLKQKKINVVDIYRKLSDILEIDINKKIYIWGVGRNGDRAFNFFEKIRINLEGFIDSNISIKKKRGLFVYSPNEIKNNSYIIITPFEYRSEIKKQIDDLRLLDVKYFDLYMVVNCIMDS